MNRRADNIKEAVNLLEEEKYRANVLKGFDSLGSKLDFVSKNIKAVSIQINGLNNEIHKLDLHMNSINAQIKDRDAQMEARFLEQCRVNKQLSDTMSDVSKGIEESNNSLRYLKPEFRNLD